MDEKYRLKTITRFNTKYKVDEATGCWLWTAGKGGGDYGIFSMNRDAIIAYRAAYILFKGDIPPFENVRHTCGNAMCVNPDHLYIANYSVVEYTNLSKKTRALIDALKVAVKETYGENATDSMIVDFMAELIEGNFITSTLIQYYK